MSMVGGKLHAVPTTPSGGGPAMAEPVVELDGIPFLGCGTDEGLRAIAHLIRYADFQRERAELSTRAAGLAADVHLKVQERIAAGK